MITPTTFYRSKDMKIKVSPENTIAIETALKEANGKAENFVFSSYSEIANLAENTVKSWQVAEGLLLFSSTHLTRA